MTNKDVPKATPEVFERKPTTPRARSRNPVTDEDVDLGRAMQQLRTMAGLSLRDVGERMVQRSGAPHYLVAVALERIATEGPSRDLWAQLGKAPQRLETARQAPTVSALTAYSRALGVEPATILEAAGLSRPRVSLEASIMGHAELDDAGKAVLLDMLRNLLAARRR